MTDEPQAPEFREPLPVRKGEQDKPTGDTLARDGGISHMRVLRGILDAIETDAEISRFIAAFNGKVRK